MSSQIYGGYAPSFLRAVNPALPVGVGDADEDVQRVIGPYTSAAQLYISPFAPKLKAAGMFVEVPPSYAWGASSFTLHALDRAIVRFPAVPSTIAAVVPPSSPGQRTYFLELRRIGGYDSGLSQNDASPATPPRPPLGVVIHFYDPSRKRMVYVDTMPLSDHRGDRDYHSFAGGFTFRVTSIGADFQSVGITVGGREFWRNFGVNIENVITDDLGTTQTPWTPVLVSPCFMFAPGSYTYHLEHHFLRHTLVVTSFGYELPTYVWTVNGVVLDPAKNKTSISTSVETLKPTGKSVATATVQIEYSVGPDRLSLGCNPEVGNFSLLVEVKSAESSPAVLKNLYEDKTQVTSVRFNNVKLIWDERFNAAKKACADALDKVNDKHIPVRKVGTPTPGDPYRGRSIDALVREFVDAGVRVVDIAAREAVNVGNILIREITRGR